MNAFDEDLIRALQRDGRAQFSEIARILGVHRSVVAQRVHELLETEELRVIAAVHPRLLGFPVQAHLALRLAGPTDPVFERLVALDSAVYVSEITGPWQAVVELWVPSHDALARAMERVRAIPGVVEVQLSIYDRVVRTMFLGEEPDPGELELDDLDIALMAELQSDGRLTFGELARRTGRSASACRARVLRLLDSRVMQVGGVRQRQRSTGAVLFGVGIALAEGADAAPAGEVEQAVLDIPGVEFLARTIGRHPLIATVAARSLAEYTGIVRDLRAHPGVAAAETWVHASVWLERYDWNLERLRARRD
ncbi:Lrp/AsnC family transcriptional regulator [Leucobacter ruminantium]|uniref:Lrp/AsnC family transcriptional regulator n=1 Tax=Leucobacter ruminantium TaxID=1289170 RepID=A0A939RXT9_9MICO|nr:Lrp/AsnC family transcriptional regulator [Leucobacter ruminantium]MBO1806512.1 Lrp/AsnC family transcriptional regulator [Leucobacter ruminantium]